MLTVSVVKRSFEQEQTIKFKDPYSKRQTPIRKSELATHVGCHLECTVSVGVSLDTLKDCFRAFHLRDKAFDRKNIRIHSEG